MFSFALAGAERRDYVLNVFNSRPSPEPLPGLDEGTLQARIVGRLVFGAILLAGAAVLVDRLTERDAPEAFATLAATWTIAFVAGSIAQIATGAVRTRPHSAGLRTASYVVPTLGIALLLPLTLHLPVALALGVDAAGFDRWAQLSLMITAPAHVVFAALAAIRAYQLARGAHAISTTRVYVTTLVVACIPFAILFFIPPILVGLTGVAILPLLDRMPQIIQREGIAPLPTAVALR